MNSISDRVLEIWWAYYQCEPFGSQWEQTASIATMIHANTVMAAASKGGELKPLGVVDFMPGDSMSWKKRTRLGSRGINHPKAQTDIIKRAFGFQ